MRVDVWSSELTQIDADVATAGYVEHCERSIGAERRDRTVAVGSHAFGQQRVLLVGLQLPPAEPRQKILRCVMLCAPRLPKASCQVSGAGQWLGLSKCHMGLLPNTWPAAPDNTA